ncbi:MAG TPA: hypothetical protein VJ876_08100 [Bacteroidales bacterium]|nr:hypothetical protein [Bacteroidales bacterium]
MLRRLIIIILGAISVILGILYYSGGEMAGGEPVYTNHILIWAAILAVLAAGMSLLFPLAQIIANPKRGRGTLIGILGLVIVALIAYSMASSQPLEFTTPNPDNVAPVLKNAGAGLITMYLLVGIGLVSIIFTEVSKSFK